MTTVENPGKHLSYLQQCLSSDKKPLGVFLGAGCPMAIRLGGDETGPLIPDIAGISQAIRSELATHEQCAPLLERIDEHFNEDGRSDTTVEDLLTHVRALRAVVGNAQVRGLCAAELDKLDETICNLVHKAADKQLPSLETPYHNLASWIEAIRRKDPVEIFTTNYDLLMEQAFEDARVPYFDGFAGARKPFFDLRAMEEDMLPSRWARLWKLHGSINWYAVEGKGVFRGTAAEDGGAKRVIHPSHLKYQESRRLPYLAMIDRLRAFLKQPTAVLVLCGYSFRDDHINEVIVQGLQSTPTAIAFGLLYGRLAEIPRATSLARNRSNLSILARDGAVISGQLCTWPQKNPESVSDDDAPWLTWVSVDDDTENSWLTAEFMLGDFAVLGGFLQTLVGNSGHNSEIQRAE